MPVHDDVKVQTAKETASFDTKNSLEADYIHLFVCVYTGKELVILRVIQKMAEVLSAFI